MRGKSVGIVAATDLTLDRAEGRGRRGPRRRRVLAAAVVATSAGLSSVSAIATERAVPSRSDFQPPATWISGTIQVNGCRFRPSQIRLGAFPVQPRINTERPVAIDGRAVSRRAVVLPTGSPHVFTFRVLGLRPQVSYRLKIGLPPSPCGQVFWRGPLGGLAAGGQRGLLIEGFAATSELEILDPRADRWVGMDHLGFDDPLTGTRTFRWRSSLRGVTGGELQVATAPFPVGSDTCAEPDEGILLRQEVPRSAGAWVRTAPVDFNSLLLPVRDRVGRRSTGTRTRDVTEATVELLSLGAPLYVRVAPRTARGFACDARRQGVGGWVVLAQIPDGPPPIVEPPIEPPALEAGNDHTYQPPFLDFHNGNIHPSYREEAFLVIKDHVLPSKTWCQLGNPFDPNDSPGFGLDSYGCLLVMANAREPGSVLKAGSSFYYSQTTSSSGGSGLIGALEDLSNSLAAIVTGAITAVGLGVDFLADLYEEAKQAVAKVVKSVITAVPGLGQLCSAHPAQCEAAIQTGITTGLTAMGVPPSLPNWDQLKQQGVDYLAAEIASQTGVPQEVVDEALKVAQEAMNQMTENRGLLPQPGYNWLIPYLGIDPAVLTIDIRKNDPSPLPLPMSLRRFVSPPFTGGAPRIPRTFINDPNRLRIPMVLRPNLSGIAAPLCSFSLGGSEVTCGPNLFNPQVAACRFQVFGSGALDYQFFKCPEKVLSVYYRTEWLPKLATGCEILATAALNPGYEIVFVPTLFGPVPKVKKVWNVVPGYTFGVAGAVEPPVFFSWSGPFGTACS